MNALGLAAIACLGCTKAPASSAKADPGPRGGSAAMEALAPAPAAPVPPAPVAPAEPPAPSVPDSPGKLTADTMISLGAGFVGQYDDWETALGKLTARLGPPTRISDSLYTWAAVTHDVCALIEVTKLRGAEVNMSGWVLQLQDPRGFEVSHYGPADAMMDRGRCIDLAMRRP